MGDKKPGPVGVLLAIAKTKRRKKIYPAYEVRPAQDARQRGQAHIKHDSAVVVVVRSRGISGSHEVSISRKFKGKKRRNVCK